MKSFAYPSAAPWTLPPLLAVLCLVLLPVAGCGDAEAPASGPEVERTYQVGEPVEDSAFAAIVTSEYGSDTLSTSLFRQQFNMAAQQLPTLQADEELRREVRLSILEDFVERHVLLGEADRQQIDTDTGAVTSQLDQLRQRFPDEEAFQEALAAQRITEDSLRGVFGDMVRQQALRQRLAEDVEAPSPEEVEAFRQEQSAQVRAQHILFLVPPTADDTQRQAIRQEAEAVLDSAQAGEDFAELAQQHSEDGTASRGGDLGYFSRGQMVEPFEEAVFALPDSGAITPDLVETRFGFHIIRLTGRRTTAPMDTAMARGAVLRMRQQETLDTALDALQAKATLRVNPDVLGFDPSLTADS